MLWGQDFTCLLIYIKWSDTTCFSLKEYLPTACAAPSLWCVKCCYYDVEHHNNVVWCWPNSSNTRTALLTTRGTLSLVFLWENVGLEKKSPIPVLRTFLLHQWGSAAIPRADGAHTAFTSSSPTSRYTGLVPGGKEHLEVLSAFAEGFISLGMQSKRENFNGQPHRKSWSWRLFFSW